MTGDITKTTAAGARGTLSLHPSFIGRYSCITHQTSTVSIALE